MRVVKVQVLIDEGGKVISAKAEPSGRPDLIYPMFAGAAEDAALKSVFTPTIRSGAAVKVKGTIVFRFNPR